MINFEQTIIAQYANSPVLTRIISNFNQYIDPNANLDAFYNLIWNVDTAEGYGLDVWARIVGVNRVLQVASTAYFGFAQGVPGVLPFNQAPFYAGEAITSNYALSDNGLRVLIYAKALANISDGSIKSINQVLLNLFPGRGNCYVTDGEDMTMTYTFHFVLTPVEASIVLRSGALPKPAGVTATVVQM